MQDKYNFKYTNGYANYGKVDSDELIINGECKITNYDPETEDGKKKGQITIDFSKGESSIKAGTSSGYSETEKANFSKKKFSIFKEIAALDENKNELSVYDLQKIDNTLLKKWGLTNIKFNYFEGVITLEWGENDILRIDFTSWTEKYTKFPFTKYTPAKVTNIDTTRSSQKTTTNDSRNTTKTPQTIEDAYNNVYTMIPKEYDMHITRVAQNAGVSEDLVRTFIINEGKDGTKEAALTAYKRKGDVWTIGFGHTNLCRSMDFQVKEGVTITLEEAFNLLEGDIKEMKKYARNSVGAKNFDKSPKSIQGLFIEYCFQNGPGGKLKSDNMKANLNGNYYKAIAAGSLFDGNYNRRSAYRFMLAISDLSIEDKKGSLQMLKNKGNYTKIVNCLSGSEKILFEDFCRQIENA